MKTTTTKQQTCFAVKVYWVSPRTGKYADTNEKMLSLGEPFIEVPNSVGCDLESDARLFRTIDDAKAFVNLVESTYKPQYFVIDDEGETLLRDGEPIVAWMPELKIVEETIDFDRDGNPLGTWTLS